MNKKCFALILMWPGLMLTGCSSMSNTDAGILGGGAIGAGTGAIVGHALGNTGAGALVGAGVGALTGGLIGHSEDKQEARAIAAANAKALGLTDVAQMSRAGISESVIISQIRTSPTVFSMSATDIVWLKEQGVSDHVITEMQMTASRYPGRIYRPVYVVEPQPVAVGIGYSRGW
jgi:hypothetical protein